MRQRLDTDLQAQDLPAIRQCMEEHVRNTMMGHLPELINEAVGFVIRCIEPKVIKNFGTDKNNSGYVLSCTRDRVFRFLRQQKEIANAK